MIRFCCIVGIALLSAACATSSQPKYFFDELVVVNNSREIIRDVTIRDVANDRVFTCGNVAPLGICSNSFGRRPYQQNPIRIEWSFGGEALQTQDFVVPVPPYFYPSLALRGVLEISPQGAVRAYFDQDTPNN